MSGDLSAKIEEYMQSLRRSQGAVWGGSMIVTAPELLYEVSKYCRPWWKKLLLGFRSHLYDLEYYMCTQDQLLEFLEWWRKEQLPSLMYTPEKFDCDDFAFLFKALCVMKTHLNCSLLVGGEVRQNGELLGLHAWNLVVVDAPREVQFVEPQTGEILQVVQGKIVRSDGWEYVPLWVVG